MYFRPSVKLTFCANTINQITPHTVPGTSPVAVHNIYNIQTMKRNSLKRILSVLLLLSLTFGGHCCTNLIVGKKASADGSVMCTYNCDGFGFAGSMGFNAAGMHPEGELIAIHGWGPRHDDQFVKQVPYTHGVVGFINDHQVSIVETTFDGRLELQNKDGLLDYFSLINLTLQRSTSAREAIAIMDQLVQEYGYNSTGESFAICDKEEAWIMEMMGKGPGEKGAVWVALRVPDDCICAYANLSRIRQFPLKDKENCLYSKDVITFARKKGLFQGKDAEFSFRDTYCPIDFENVRYGDARVWSFFRHHSDPAEMDKYLPYINGQFDQCDHLPLWIKPNKPLSVRDLMQDMRDHYEGTPLDMSADMSAGPWASPYRNQPINYKTSDGTTLFRERPIGCQQSGMTMVCQMRSWLPDELGGIIYFNLDDANMVAYVPVFCGSTRVPDPFRRDNNNIREFSEQSAFWINNFVANMIYPRYSAMIGDLREAQAELEDYYASDLDSVAAQAATLTRADRIALLTNKSAEYTDLMMKRWQKLAKLLIVKHNDQIMQPSENGVVVPGRRTYPAYSQPFIDAIKTQTGDRYIPKEVIERRQR